MSELVLLGAAPPARQPSAAGTLELIGVSAAAVRSQKLVQRASALECGVLLVGEPGCDLAGIARELHRRGRTASGPFITADCGAGPGNQLDRRLFGSRSA